MSAALAHNGLPEKVRPVELVSLVKVAGQARRDFKRISSAALNLLQNLIEGSCRKEDFLRGRICGSWEQPATLAAKFGISEQVYHNAEAELRRASLVERTSNAHARRAGERRLDGSIAWLSGLSLRPLIDSYEELVEIRDAFELEKQAIRAVRQEIKQVSRQIRALEDHYLRAQAEQILPRGRTSKIHDTARLKEIKADLEALLVLVELPSANAESSQQCEDFCAPNIPQENHSEKRIAANVPKMRREPARDITPVRAASLASEDYQETLTALGGPSWPNLVETSSLACNWLGISQTIWGEACHAMGRERAALCVLVIDRNRRLPEGHRYHRKHATSSLEGMIRKGSDSLNLLGLLRAMEGYPGGANGRVEPLLKPMAHPPRGVHTLGSVATELVAKFSEKASKLKP